MINIDDLELMEVRKNNMGWVKRFVLFGNKNGGPVISIADHNNKKDLKEMINKFINKDDSCEELELMVWPFCRPIKEQDYEAYEFCDINENMIGWLILCPDGDIFSIEGICICNGKMIRIGGYVFSPDYLFNYGFLCKKTGETKYHPFGKVKK